jgi:hypothetical protein
MVIVNVEVSLRVIEVGLNDLAICGGAGATTARLAVLLGRPAVVVCVVVTPEVVFGCTPIVLLLTEKITVQLAFAGSVIL